MEGGIIVPPSFAIPGEDHNEVIDAAQILAGRIPGAESFVGASVELYVRQMLTSGATRLEYPVPLLPEALGVDRLLQLLPPTAAARVGFVDKKSRTWNAVVEYLKPVAEDLMRNEDPPPPARTPLSFCAEMAAHIYSISLSRSIGNPVIAPPVPMLELADEIGGLLADPEAKARLAVVRGMATDFVRHEEIPALVCVPGSASRLANRVDEILEDAYLLEVSAMRAFLSPEANWASLRRRLRKLLGWVVENRSWAQGLFRVGRQTLAMPGDAGLVSESLNAIGAAAGDDRSPVVLLDAHSHWGGPETVVQVKYPGGLGIFPPSMRS